MFDLDDLTPEQQALLTLRLRDRARRQAGRAHQVSPIEPVPRDGDLALSFAQQRLWFFDRLEPGNPAYNIFDAFRFTGDLDVIALRRSLDGIVRRHEVLRATFGDRDGRPVQNVGPVPTRALPTIDLRELPATGREQEAQRLATEEAQRPFDLERGPVMRTTLLRPGEADYVLLMTIHHIVSDGWSMGILMREILALYAAFSAGQPSPLPPLPLQYVDYAQWQREWLQGEVLESQVAYWKRQLAGAPGGLDLPADRPRPPVQTYRGAEQFLHVPGALTEALDALSRQEGATLFMTLLAAFKMLLYRYTRQHDVVVGSPIAGRNRAEIEGLIGFFANTLALRTDLGGNPSFRELVNRVRRVTLEAYAHQDLPFERLVDELQLERDLSRNPLFQVMFVLQNAPLNVPDVPQVAVTVLKTDSRIARFDLTLIVMQDDAGLSGTLEYNTDLFDGGTIARVIAQFKGLLAQIVENPDVPIQAYSLVTPEARPLLPDPRAPLPEPEVGSLADVFSAQAERAADRVAVCCGEWVWTYRALAARARALARTLVARGVERGDVVAVFGPRSFDLVAAMTAVPLAGGVLLTIDPRLPALRRRLVIREAGAGHLVCAGDSSPEDAWIRDLSIPVLHAGRDDGAGEGENAQVDLPDSSPGDAAYVFFTSGTTGVPKGVLGCHKGLCHFVAWQREMFGVGPLDRSAQLTGLSFDVVLRDVFLPLTSGATLCLPEGDDVLEPARVIPWMEREAVSLLHTVPSLAQSWLAALPPRASLHRLRWVFMAGEPLTDTLVRRWRRAFPGAGGVVNLYGPTETTLAKCFYRVPPEPPPGVQPLGWPLPQTQALVLTEGDRLCGIGEPGEIALRTPFRSLGYLNAPEQNRERFVTNPFTGDERDVVYRTGDLGRYRADGSLEFLGRVDEQLKIQGVRIEPGEIEAVLEQHPAVAEAAVAARKDGPGSKRLLAYVAPTRYHAPTIGGRTRYRLANNMAIVQLNKNETDYLYGEVFERQVYLKHGISITDGDCLLDVGANIGLFTLFAGQVCQEGCTVYAFEPNPTVFELLRTNTSLYASDTRLRDYGLSDEPKTATFTFFPGFSMLSGFYADAETEREVVRNYVRNQQEMGLIDAGELLDEAGDVLDGRFEARTFETRLSTVSHVLREEGIDHVSLLKVNVEKSELDVLRGIEDDDWSRIDQIVVEVDVRENLERITALLEQRGYDIAVERDVLLANTELCYVYAIRPSGERALVREQGEGAHVRSVPVLQEHVVSAHELRLFAGERLPTYVVPSAFVLLEALPLTPNGKVDRQALSSLDPDLAGLEKAFVAPGTHAERTLAGIWADVLQVERVGIHDNFFELGGNSLLGVRMIAQANQRGLQISNRQLFQHQTLAGLAAASTPQVRRAEQGAVTGSVPLTPIQHWFFEMNYANPHYYNQAFLFQARRAVDAGVLDEAVRLWLAHHDALRLRFVRDESGWRQAITEPGEVVPFTHVDLSEAPRSAQEPLVAAAAAACQVAFDLARGEVVRVVSFDCGPRRSNLLTAFHYLGADVRSLQFLLEDLLAAYEQIGLGKPPSFPPKTSSFKQWAERLWEHARSEEIRQEAGYWLAGLHPRPHPLPVDHPGGANTRASARIESVLFGARETQALMQLIPRVLRIQTDVLVLTAMVQALARWSGGQRFLIDLARHGREPLFDDVDVSRTAGWFTTITPALLGTDTDDPERTLASIEEQLSFPDQGFGYGLLRYLGDDEQVTARLRSLPRAGVLFNYIGQWFDIDRSAAAVFRPIRMLDGSANDLQSDRGYLLIVSGGVERNRLRLFWQYSENVHRKETVERLTGAFAESLRALISHCTSRGTAGVANGQ